MNDPAQSGPTFTLIAGVMNYLGGVPAGEKYFSTLKRGADVPSIKAETPKITSERRKVVKARVELPRVYMAWITSPILKPGDADAVV